MTDQNHREYSMDNHGIPKHFNDNYIVHNIAKFLNFNRIQLSNGLDHGIKRPMKKRKDQSENLNKRKERKSAHKACHYSWTCCYFLRAFVTSFKLGDMEHLRTSHRILVSFVILDSYGSFLLGGEMF